MPKTLLLADGSVTIQRVVELTFAHEDIHVVALADGRKAMQWLGNERPDIVLADVDLPDNDGYSIAAHVRKTKRLQHVPVLLLAGAFEPVDQDRARAAGCDGVIIKPFEPQQLVSRVKELLTVPEPVGVGARETTSAKAAAAPAGLGTPAVAPIRVVPPPPPDLTRVMKNEPLTGTQAQMPPLTLEPLPLAPEKLELPAQPLWQGSGAFGSVASPPPRGEPLAPPPAPAPPPTPAKVSLASAFSALLAAEQSTMPAPIAPMPAQAAPTVVIPDSSVEEAVRKVLVRLTDDLVRRIVLETAERLIREEIEKIKANPE
jgi:CheY-like chemotaxis protein